jgi:hypothetical protein
MGHRHRGSSAGTSGVRGRGEAAPAWERVVEGGRCMRKFHRRRANEAKAHPV